MANALKMALIEAILSLRRRGWSRRRIARELGIDRETVTRHLRAAAEPSKPANAPPGPTGSAADPKPANAPIGSEPNAGASKPANAPTGSEVPGTDVVRASPEPAEASQVESDPSASPDGVAPMAPNSADLGAGRPSDCAPWRTLIEAKLDQGLTAQRIYQDLVTEHGFTGSYYSVRRFTRRLGQGRPLPFRRLECGPGEEAQVDFGTGAPIRLAEGRLRRPHVFRIVLSYSRKGYSEAVSRQTTDSFLRSLENAFWHFGGVPQRLVLDNLRAAVSKADWFDPDLNPKVQAFCQHYGLVMLPTKPRTPRHKGKIERGIGYVKGNALKGHVFASLDEQNQHLLHWEQTVADTRMHGTTRQQVGKRFHEERTALQPLPAARFPCFNEGRRIVHRDGHVEVDKAYYSVPPEHLGRQVWVQWDNHLVRVLNQRQQSIAVHAKRQPGCFSTQNKHIPLEKTSPIEHGAERLLGKVRRLGMQATRWAEAMIQVRGVAGVRVLYGLLSLSRRHSGDQIDRACGVAHGHGAYRLRVVRALLQRHEAEQPCFEFMDEHPLIRPLSEYANLVHHSFHKEIS
jgi:transposase